ncbi:hypothetical protein DFH27DRAFT_146266 [Peziza echinospora]|nr:hypothetical protein DFH27DRAFT_146266 [Peziza echinospora]
MASPESTWSEEEAVQKVLRRAEVSRIARTLQHRLALASYKTKHGLEKFDLDTIEPRVEEDLKRKRSSARNSEPPGHYGEVDLEWLRENGERRNSHAPEHGLSPARKRPRTSSSDPQLPPPTKRRPSNSWKHNNRRLPNSSPGYRPYSDYDYQQSMVDDYTTTTESNVHSSPPQTPPRQADQFAYARPVVDGSDLIYLSASPSPAHMMPKTKLMTPSTPPSRAAVLPSSVMGAPQTPQTGFNFADFVNITPSPAQAAFPSGTIRAPLATRKRLNFDNIVPPSGPQNMPGPRMNAMSVLEIGGELVK